LTEEKRLTCILCPNGCRLEIALSGGKIEAVKNNRCSKGKDYAQSELFDPRRLLTATVKVKGGIDPLVSVRSTLPVPKGILKEMVWRLRQVEVAAPMDSGTVVAPNIMGTGADIITTAAVKVKK